MDEPKRQKRLRRSFTDDFKASAVRLVLEEGKAIPQVARDLDLTESALRQWVERARADRTQGKTGLTSEERSELARLRKENRELRMEREILKKAAAHSTGRCNADDSCSWRVKAEYLARPLIQSHGDHIEVVLAESGEVEPLRKILPQ
jgi:transposase